MIYFVPRFPVRRNFFALTFIAAFVKILLYALRADLHQEEHEKNVDRPTVDDARFAALFF